MKLLKTKSEQATAKPNKSSLMIILLYYYNSIFFRIWNA